MSQQADNNVMRFDTLGTSLDHYYRNEIDFPVLGNMENATILIADKIKSWERKGNEITFQVEGVFYRKVLFYRFFDYRARYDRLKRTRNICVKLTIWADHTVRIQAMQGYAIPERDSEMLIRTESEAVDYTLQEDHDSIRIKTELLNIVITKHPWNISIYDVKGIKVFSQFASSRTEANPVARYELCPFGFLFDLTTNMRYAAEQIAFGDDEHFYGFGEKFMDLDKRGQSIDLWNTNALSCNTPRTYKNIPFFVSTRGYGLFVHSSHAINCNMGQHSSKSYSIMSSDEAIDYFFIYGPQFSSIIPRYTDLTGKTPLPPKWSFGFWISKISYRSQAEVENLMQRFRDEDIPCDVVHLDTDWYEHNWICDYKFSKNRFSDPERMMKEARMKGFRITLWQMPYIENNPEHPNDVYLEGFEKGYFAFREDGTADFKHGLIDFSNPEAVEWYKNKLIRPLLEMGVSGIKADFGESIPVFYKYVGASGEEMHNLYPLLYNKAVFEITEEVRGKGEGIIWARSTWAGSQRFPVHWGGDPDVDFPALASTVRAGLSIGLSGFPFWSHDVGGFHAPTTPEVYARWMQVGCFSSHCRAHGVKTREPWDFGDEVKEIAKKYLNLRYRLMPYIYSQSWKCTETSLPMFRALVIEFQDDRNVYGIDNQYMFGDSFLVSPIMDDTNERALYLPEGEWTDYWTKSIVKAPKSGRWITVSAPLDMLPLHIKENAIIPIGPFQNYVDEHQIDLLCWDLYPVKGKATFTMLNDDHSQTAIAVNVSDDHIDINVSGAIHKSEFLLNNIDAISVLLDGVKIEFGRKEHALQFLVERTGDYKICVQRIDELNVLNI